MDSQEEVQGSFITPRSKKRFFEKTAQIQKELGKWQREYKKIISIRLKSRPERILEKSHVKTISRLESERNDLRSQIWVANGKAHTAENTRHMNLIKCHVRCQEFLAKDIQKLKIYISHLERDIIDKNKEIYDLNRKTIPETQHQDHVKRSRKKMSILENRLEVGIRRESGFTAANAVLREELTSLLFYRDYFNDTFTKLIQKLNNDKKYLFDLLQYASNTFEDCINVHEKIENNLKKKSKEKDNLRADMQSEIRKSVAANECFAFIEAKNTLRELAPIEPKEIARREEFCRYHQRKINLYNNELNKLLNYTNTIDVEAVIEAFQNQESTYYSYYTLAIEIGYHITLLQNSVNRLYQDLGGLRSNNNKSTIVKDSEIEELEKIYEEKKVKNEELKIKLEKDNERLEKLFNGIAVLFNMSRSNAAPLMLLLGDHTRVNVHNLHKFMKIFETRLLNILTSVSVKERNDITKAQEDYVVKEVHKFQEYPTNLDDIVLAQQCPECAEGEAFNMDDAGVEGVYVHTVEEAKKKLSEKVNQPEMQYRLHSISTCRLPRSHLLVARR